MVVLEVRHGNHYFIPNKNGRF